MIQRMPTTYPSTRTWEGKRADGTACSIVETTDVDVIPATGGSAAQVFEGSKRLFVDYERANYLEKGKYQIFSTGEIVISDDPNAP